MPIVAQHHQATSNQSLSEDALWARFSTVRARSLALVAPLSEEDCALQSMADASPAKWHLAHTTWFFETFILERFEPDFAPFNPAFRVLFNSYYNGVGEKHPRAQRGLISRPNLAEVKAYRANVDARIEQLQGAALADEARNLITLGTHHEEQHQELLLTDLKHLFSCNPAKPAYHPRWPLVTVAPQPTRWLRYAGGLTQIGVDAGIDTCADFSFDNEGPRHAQYVAPFELASQPVRYGDYAAFIAAGGYQQPQWWLSMGWEWRTQHKIEMPLYWENRGSALAPQWWNFTLTGMVPIEPNTPMCHLSYFEADAFARWSGARLPTEFEWEVAAQAQLKAQPIIVGNFIESGMHHPLAQTERSEEPHPVKLFGDVWEWTQSSYAPYHGFASAPGAVGEYNGKFMCNQYVLRGGSCATPRDHIRATYRNFFPPEARWQFSGLRLARDAH